MKGDTNPTFVQEFFYKPAKTTPKMEEDMRDGKQRGRRGTTHWDENPTFVGGEIAC